MVPGPFLPHELSLPLSRLKVKGTGKGKGKHVVKGTPFAFMATDQVHRKFAVESSGFIEPDDGGAEVFANRINHCNEFVHAAQFTSQLTFAVHAHAKVHALLIEEVSEGGQPIRHINMH